jgi:LMBR1 domain-containing protein 1
VFFFFLFAFYMELCVIKGNFKFGIRVPFLFQLHPMKQNYTLVSSFLFNCELLLVTSYAVVEFSAQSFSVYARDTSAQGTILFACSVLTILALLVLFWQSWLSFSFL